MVCSAGDRTRYDDGQNTYQSVNERNRRKVSYLISSNQTRSQSSKCYVSRFHPKPKPLANTLLLFKTGPNRDDHHEETGYVYQPSPAMHGYPTAPPYNPEYLPSEEYGGGHRAHMDHYPTGVIPPGADGSYRQPLINPPPYHDVVGGHHK